MIGKVHGGGMQGIPSNLGTIKAYCQRLKSISLSKGTKSIPLNLPCEMERIVGIIINYGGYISSQAMMNENGDYTADYGLNFRINYQSKEFWITSSGSYPERDLTLIIFYI